MTQTIREITENFYTVTLPMPFRLEHVQVFLLIQNNKMTLFDTGMNIPEVFPVFERSLHSIGQAVENIDHIFLTHSHADHCGLAGRVKDVSGATIHMSKIGSTLIQHFTTDENAINKQRKEFFLHLGLPDQTIKILETIFVRLRMAITPFQADELFDSHQKVSCGNKVFEILPTPGHSHDHVCFFFRNEGILLSGDHVLPIITPNLFPDPGDSDYYPLNAYLDSLDLVQDLPVEIVYPGHGKPFGNLKERVKEIKKHTIGRKRLIFDCIVKKPQSVFQVSQEIFGTDLPTFDKFLATNEAYAHLRELQKAGAIKTDTAEELFMYSAI